MYVAAATMLHFRTNQSYELDLEQTTPNWKDINTSYLTDSYIGFTLKMESVSKNTIFGLKVMVKSGLEKLF